MRSSITVGTAASGTYYGRIVSVASNEPTIYIDDCYWGLSDGFNTYQVSQAELYGAIKYAGNASCLWTTGNTGGNLTEFSADTDCSTPTTYGRGEAPATKVPRIKFSSLPPGKYQVVFLGQFGPENTTTTASINFRGYDGSTSSGVQRMDALGGTAIVGYPGTMVAYFEYSTAQTNIEFRPRAQSTSDSNDPFIVANTSDRDFEIQVYRFPTQTELAARTNLPVLPTIQTFTAAGACTYTRPNGVSWIRVRMVGAGGGGAGSSTNANNGGSGGNGGNTTFGSSFLTAQGGFGGAGGGAGQGGNGGTATIASPAYGTAISGAQGTGGTVNATASSSDYMAGAPGASSPFGGGGGGGQSATAGKAAPVNSGAGGGGGAMVNTSAAVNGAGGGAGGFIDAIIPNPASSYSCSVGAEGAAGTAGTSGFAGGTGGRGYIEVTEYYQNSNAVQYIGSVTSNALNMERVERAIVNSCTSNGACTISSQSSSWLGVTRNSAGDYTMAITSGTFSAIPTCSVTCENIRYIGGSATSATAGSIAVRNTTPAADDCGGRMNIVCMGPR